MDGAVAQAVLACLGDGASPRQLLARIDDLAARAEAPARVPDELADALLGVVLAGRPPPALALAYLREACAGAHLGYAAGAAVDASVVLAALLARVQQSPEMSGAHLADEVTTPHAYVVPAWSTRSASDESSAGGVGGRPPSGRGETLRSEDRSRGPKRA